MSKTLTFNAAALATLGLALGSCQPNIEDNHPAATAGAADFTSYVAVGNSLTSGYADGGLYNAGIRVSYPAILAQQFAKTERGPANFVQPLFDESKKDGSGYLKLVNSFPTTGPNAGATVAAPTQPTPANMFLGEQLAVNFPIVSLPGGNQLAAYTGSQPDNLGVPGISVLSSVSALTGGLAPFGYINPFFERLLPASERFTKDYVTYIGQKNATFFTCWLGSNDVLTYATNGATNAPDPVSGTVNPFGDLTDTTRFGAGYRAILRTMTRNGTVKGAAANIPNVTNIPYFTTVTVGAVAASFKAINPASPGVFIQTSSATAPVRLATSADLLTLTAQGYIAAVVAAGGTAPGSLPTSPLPNKYVLDASEVSAVTARTTQLNVIIAKTARQYKVALADMSAYFTNLAAQGVVTDGVSNSATFATGNLFSLDGVHPTPRGYALIANEWIRNINAYYGATIPTVAPNDYRGVLFP